MGFVHWDIKLENNLLANSVRNRSILLNRGIHVNTSQFKQQFPEGSSKAKKDILCIVRKKS
uniref:Uncharacterized protein n=1 Tax=Populus trichocarpa TaxID=3694 RepID=A0A2K1WXC0_POPTR